MTTRDQTIGPPRLGVIETLDNDSEAQGTGTSTRRALADLHAGRLAVVIIAERATKARTEPLRASLLGIAGGLHSAVRRCTMSQIEILAERLWRWLRVGGIVIAQDQVGDSATQNAIASAESTAVGQTLRVIMAGRAGVIVARNKAA